MAAVASINNLGKYAFNPRGNLWLNDENRFGHKLLLKMGWNKGKGLGKNEDGISENIRLNYKNDNLGVGFKDKMLRGIQDQDYDSLLSKLSKSYAQKGQGNEQKTDKNSEASLEQRSQKFRNRLHYQKFVRGKDVSRYSDEDMKSIFIVKKVPTDELEPDPEKTENLENRNTESIKSMQDLMKTYKSELSVEEYFAKKLKDKSGIALSNNFVKKEDSPNTQSMNSSDVQGRVLESSTESEVSQKKRKKSGNSKKHKKLKLETCKLLKSCLKLGTSGNYSLKKTVSFNETLSYQNIDSDFTEEDTSQNVVENGAFNNETEVLDGAVGKEMFKDFTQDEGENYVETGSVQSNLNCEIQQGNQDRVTNNDWCEKEIEVQEMESIDYSCFKLPSLPQNLSCNYNCWRESQKQALKMDSYKNMLKRIRKHPILKTTNLLDIKGYGNWGF